MRRTHFDPGPAPKNYVAGLGRGAVGFSTRGDVGSGFQRSAGRGGGAGEGGALNEASYDAFSGYSENLFGGSEYTAEDREADEIYRKVDERMAERRKEQREKREKEVRELSRKLNPKLQTEFSDLSRELSGVSDDQWMEIPEIGDRSVKKSVAMERYTPVSDSMLAGAHAAANSTDSSIDLAAVSKVQKLQLDSQLDKASKSVAGQTAVNAQGYMTAMAQSGASMDVMDVDRARDLLTSVRVTNRSHAPGWIAAARLEEVAGKVSKARKIILEGCSACPTNEDVWMEAARLHDPATAKGIFAEAVRHIPRSVKLWLVASQLEADAQAKRRVLRKGLELNPASVQLWKAACELEGSDDARTLLEKAVECAPQSVELWLALAHLSDYKGARAVLNRARKAIPTEVGIWVTAARLEEAHGNASAVTTIVQRAVRSLSEHNVVITRDKWLGEAKKAETAESPQTCTALVHETIGIGVEQVDRKRVWLEDSETAQQEGHVHTARAILAHALGVWPSKKSIWLRAAQLEKKHGSFEALAALLRQAVRSCPHAELLWLMAAKEHWLAGQVDTARRILNEAFVANQSSEAIWVAAGKLERENGRLKQASAILQKARKHCDTPRIWVKSIKLQSMLEDANGERALVEKALSKFPREPKIWVLATAMEERAGNIDAARNLFSRATKNCPDAVQLWLNAADLEIRGGVVGKARAILELGRTKNPTSDQLWLKAVRVEASAGQQQAADAALARGLQACPTSPALLAESIRMAPKAKRRLRCVDALKACDSSAVVLLEVAKVFWADRRLDKARTWLQRAVGSGNSKLGDAWAHMYAFERDFGSSNGDKELVLERCEQAQPDLGELWKPARRQHSSLSARELCKLLGEEIEITK